MRKHAKSALGILAVILVAAILLGIYFVTRPKTGQGSKTISVEVTHSDDSTATFTYDTDADYLGDVLLSEGLVEGEEGEYGLYITVVDGESAIYEEDGSYWALYQNGEYAMQGADQTPINDGDTFSLVYTVG